MGQPCLWPLTQWDLRRCVYGWFEAMRLDRPRPRHGGMQATGPGGLGGLCQVGIESPRLWWGGGGSEGQRVVGEGGLGDTGDGRELHRPSCGIYFYRKHLTKGLLRRWGSTRGGAHPRRNPFIMRV